MALHVPLTLFLVGVVLRGSAFAFRTLDMSGDPGQRRFGLVFSMASTIAPVLLGTIVGALGLGRHPRPGRHRHERVLRRLAGAVPARASALFALALCALPRRDLPRRSRRAIPRCARTSAAARWPPAVAVGVVALLAFLLAGDGAPRVRAGLAARRWSWPFHALTGAAAVTALCGARDAALSTGARRRRRADGPDPVGWALAQYPYLVVPDVTVHAAAASPRTSACC